MVGRTASGARGPRIVADAGRGLDVDGKHRPDAPVPIGPPCRLDRGRIYRPRRGGRPPDDLDAERFGHLRPALGEAAGLGHEHRLARSHPVHEGSLPGAVAERGTGQDPALGAERAGQIVAAAPDELGESRGAGTDRRTRHRAEDALRDVGGSRQLHGPSSAADHAFRLARTACAPCRRGPSRASRGPRASGLDRASAATAGSDRAGTERRATEERSDPSGLIRSPGRSYRCRELGGRTVRATFVPRPSSALFWLVLFALALPLRAQTTGLDPTSVVRTGRPNDRLLCPEGFCRAPADAPAPVFEVPPERLLEAWKAVIESAPRTTLRLVDAGELRLVAEQRSRLFGFVDTIAVKILSLPDGRTSFAAYSRSETGYWDLGVNAARLEEWSRAVAERLAAASGS